MIAFWWLFSGKRCIRSLLQNGLLFDNCAPILNDRVVQNENSPGESDYKMFASELQGSPQQVQMLIRSSWGIGF